MALIRWVDENIERMVILVNYVLMAAIIFVEVIRRFIFSEQAAWSSTIPIYLFLAVTWFGCTYNVKIRTHLRFDEVRSRLPYGAQFACLMMDAVAWISFSIIVIYFAMEQVILSYENFAIVQGTDDVMQWWFYAVTPVAFLLLIFRVLQNVVEDVNTFRKGEPLNLTASLGD